jgi:tetratricopeptide (TPR) repeat protein
MAQTKTPAEALALIYLREARHWTQTRLATAKGHSSHHLISRYENGKESLSRAELHDMAALLGFPRDAVEALLLTYSLVIPPNPDESGSLVELTPEELRRIDRTVLADGWTRAAELRAGLIEDKKRKKAEAARRQAGELWARLKPLPRAVRREVMEDAPDFQTWALAVRLCEQSERAAAHDPEEALALADLALSCATRVTAGGDLGRSRLTGYAWAHKGNALRVAGHLPKANAAFERARQFWKVGANSEADLIPEWRIPYLEASLRREEHRFAEALDLLSLARIGANEDPEALAAILLKKEVVYEQMGEPERVLSTLAEAGPFVEASKDTRLLFGLRFETAKALWALQRYQEAAALLSEIRDLAEQLGNEMDFVRVLWLTAKVNAGQGRRTEAFAGLEQVRRELVARAIPYDAALSSLELAVLYLEEGRTREVQTLAREMAPIFQSQGIAREALASLAVFSEAAQRETATLDLVKRVMEEIVAARQSAPRPKKSERG